MAIEQFANGASTTLASAITSTGSTSISVTSASLFPASGNFRILIDTEIMIVTAVSGTTFTVTRGAEGSTAATHSNGVNVTHILTAGAVTQFRADNIQSGTFSSLPAAGNKGTIYLPNDSIYLARDNGTSWDYFGPFFKLTPPPAVSTFTWVNQSNGLTTTTASDTNAGIYITRPSDASSGETTSLLTKAYPSTPFTLTILVKLVGLQLSYAGIGCCIYDTVSGKCILYMLTMDSDNASGTSQSFVQCRKMNSLSSVNSGPAINVVPTNTGFIRISDDGSTRIASFSTDGVNFVTILSETNTTFVTPNKIGLCTWRANSNPSCAIYGTVMSYSLN